MKDFKTEIKDLHKFDFERSQKKIQTFGDWQLPIHKIS